MNKYEIGDVWWVDFPFEDNSYTKFRPAIVLDNEKIAILAIKVTSKDKDEAFSIKIDDYKEAGLEVPSWARIDYVVSLEEYRMDKRLGKLSDRDAEKIFTLFMELNSKAFHEFSLLSIKNSDNKFLLRYDERWDCWLFPYFRTTNDNKVTADQIASELIKSNIFTNYVTTAKHCKYSVSDQVYKIYNHKLYKYELKNIPEHMSEDEFDINGEKYKWMSFRQMENHHNIMEKNEEIVAFIKKYCK